MTNKRKIRACKASTVSFTALTPSSKGDPYTVKGHFTMGEGGVTCSCPSFMHRRKCKHVTTELSHCGWNEFSSEIETLEQRRQMVCPRCGATTINTFIVVGEGNLPIYQTDD